MADRVKMERISSRAKKPTGVFHSLHHESLKFERIRGKKRDETAFAVSCKHSAM